MPLYEITSACNQLNRSTKAEIARRITGIHCRLTGAPEAFVNVVFRDYDDCFVAGRPRNRSFVMGRIRRGRSLETRQALMRELEDMWVCIAGRSGADVLVALSEVDPALVLEAGHFMPEPGRERFEEPPPRHMAAEDGPDQPIATSRPEPS